MLTVHNSPSNRAAYTKIYASPKWSISNCFRADFQNGSEIAIMPGSKFEIAGSAWSCLENLHTFSGFRIEYYIKMSMN